MLIPGAIILAGIIVAVSIIISNSGGKAPTAGNPENGNAPSSPTAENAASVTAADHILGDPNASVLLIEFSDLECPFCKTFHSTMAQIMEEYGKDGRVAWVYRHFPLTQIHPKAPTEAEASECAAELGGNDAFWTYINRIFEITPSNNRLDLNLLPQVAEDIGLNRAAFETCLASGKYKDKIEANYNDAINSGGRGTPHTIIRTKDGSTSFSGALNVSQVRTLVEQALGSQAEK